MDDDSLEPILVETCVDVMVVVDAISGVGEDVDEFGEGTVTVKFKFLHRFEVELETFESYDQYLGEGFQTDSLDCFDFVIAFLAEIGVISL